MMIEKLVKATGVVVAVCSWMVAWWLTTVAMHLAQPVMGYAMATDDEGSYYRYTEWVWYNFSRSGKNSGAGCETCMDWTHNYGTELYNLTADPGKH